MDRRPFMCLPMLVHLLPFGPVAGAACCRAGRAQPRRGGAGGNEAVPIGTTEAGDGWRSRGRRVDSTEAGRVGSTEVGRGGFYRGGLLLMIVLSLALRPFFESYGDDHSV